MTIRKLIAAFVGAAALAGLPLQADARVDVFVDVAPPPLRYEVVPAPRAGWVWAPGHWRWRGHHHVWIAGHWIRHRPGFVYVPARWVDHGGRWVYEPGFWRR